MGSIQLLCMVVEKRKGIKVIEIQQLRPTCLICLFFRPTLHGLRQVMLEPSTYRSSSKEAQFDETRWTLFESRVFRRVALSPQIILFGQI